MWYLFGQVWLLLLISFFLGMLVHWFLCCRNKNEAVEASVSSESLSSVTQSTETVVEISDDWKPLGFANRPDKVDDLKRIKGVGAVIEETLNNLGIYQFSQLAEWTRENISWVENFIAFPGRIDREDWVNQAKTLGAGGTTEFAQRVDKGDVDY